MCISSVFLLVTLCISARDIYFFSWLCLFLHASLDVIWSAISSRYCVISCVCDVKWPRYFWTRLPYFWTRLPYFWARRAPCVPDPFYRSMRKKNNVSASDCRKWCWSNPHFPRVPVKFHHKNSNTKRLHWITRIKIFTSHPTDKYVHTNWCGKALTIHQVSRYINHQPSAIPKWYFRKGGQKKSGPQTARLCDEIGRTFPGFLVKDLLDIEKHTHTQKKHNNYWTTTWMCFLYFVSFFVSRSTNINHSILSTVWEAGKTPGICMTLRYNIITSNGSVSSMIQKSKWIRINAQNLPSKMTSRLSSLNKLTSKSEPTIPFQTVTCLVRTHHQRVKLAFLSHALTFIEVFISTSKHDEKTLVLWFCDEVASSLLHDLLLGTRMTCENW